MSEDDQAKQQKSYKRKKIAHACISSLRPRGAKEKSSQVKSYWKYLNSQPLKSSFELREKEGAQSFEARKKVRKKTIESKSESICCKEEKKKSARRVCLPKCTIERRAREREESFHCHFIRECVREALSVGWVVVIRLKVVLSRHQQPHRRPPNVISN